MAGFKRRLNESIQLKLSFSLSLAIFVMAVLAGIFSYAAAFNEAQELQDSTLRQVAALFDLQRLPPVQLADSARAKDSDEETRVVVQYLADGAKSISQGDTEALLPIPATLMDGLQTLDIGGESFRVLVKSTALGERIAVAQETGVRDEISRGGALHTLAPILILAPILLLIVSDLVRKMLLPLSVISSEIDQRAEQLHPIEENKLPIEVKPFVVAINRLLTRVAQSVDSQRRFVADAAHELRSPLTAISLQAERLAESNMSESATARLVALRQGIERSRNLLDQMLTLTKAQSTPELLGSPVAVQDLYRRVLEDLLPQAESKHIDIGVEGTQDVHVSVNDLDLMSIVKNLADNAIRYTPQGGRVDLSVSLENGFAVLQIKDSGPGIALEERERVFDPFYRTLGSEQVGSGLGLSIVRAIADRIGAEVQLAYADDERQSGLCVSVLIPKTRSHQDLPATF